MVLRFAFPLIVAIAARGSGIELADAGAPAPSSLPACIQVRTDARYVPYGYNHIVTLTSGCTRLAACTVSTDVNPEVHAVDVPANTSAQVTTFMGAAASTFVAKVSCKLR